MLDSKYQRVGALAGLVLFFGGWLGAYYDSWIWFAVAAVVSLVSFWLVLEEESTEDLGSRALKGFMLGIITAVVARALGALMMVWAFGSWSTSTTSSYDSIGDMFRMLMNGDALLTLLVILGIGAVGAFIAYAMPYFAAEREEE